MWHKCLVKHLASQRRHINAYSWTNKDTNEIKLRWQTACRVHDVGFTLKLCSLDSFIGALKCAFFEKEQKNEDKGYSNSLIARHSMHLAHMEKCIPCPTPEAIQKCFWKIWLLGWSREWISRAGVTGLFEKEEPTFIRALQHSEDFTKSKPIGSDSVRPY